MLSVICFKWHQPGYQTSFTAEHVNRLASMVRRHYHSPHTFFCVTDEPSGLAAGIEYVPLWRDHATLANPSNAHGPSCYRRLKLFSRDAARVFGERLVALDLDAVIVNAMDPLWDRPEDFIIWGDTHPRTWYNGSMFLLRTGARPQIWETFDPVNSPRVSKQAGCHGSDQGWISYCLGPNEAKWGKEDGVYSWRVHLEPRGGALPPNARVVMFHGKRKAWDPQTIKRHAWIQQHWR